MSGMMLYQCVGIWFSRSRKRVSIAHRRVREESRFYPLRSLRVRRPSQDVACTDILRYRTYMVKKLTRTGNSVALVLEREPREARGLDAGSTVEFATDGRVIIISPPA